MTLIAYRYNAFWAVISNKHDWPSMVCTQLIDSYSAHFISFFTAYIRRSMTNCIQLLPKEILSNIFRNLPSTEDTKQCQYVCRAWYTVAHLQLLERIALVTFEDIERFIRSIDSNEDSFYLSSVQQITIGRSRNLLVTDLEREHINKVFLRFPNLQRVSIYAASLESFDEETCTVIKSCCPKINTFEVSNCLSYFDTISRMKPILSTIDVNQASLSLESYSTTEIVEFFASFPRLTKIDGSHVFFNTFEKWLPLPEHLRNLTDAHLFIKESGDEEGFAERYFGNKTVEETAVITERLGSIKTLYIQPLDFYSVKQDSVDFIKEYMTGLENFYVEYEANEDFFSEGDEENSEFILRTITCCVKSAASHLRIKYLDPVFGEQMCLRAIERIFFQSDTTDYGTTDRTSYRRLVLEDLGVWHNDNPPYLDVDLHKTTSLEVCHLKCRSGYLVPTLKQCEQSLLNVFNQLILKLFEDPRIYTYVLPINDGHYYTILTSMPFLEKVTLDVPDTVVESQVETIVPNDSIKQITINAMANSSFNSLLQILSKLAPNLNRLIVNGFCGIWNEEAHEYNFDLTAYSLTTLKVDVTPVRQKVNHYIQQKGITNIGEFFVLEVYSREDSKVFLYKIPLNFSNFKRIDKRELEDKYVQGEDYFSVKISIERLQDLFIGISFKESTLEEKSKYLCYINIFLCLHKLYYNIILAYSIIKQSFLTFQLKS